MQLRLALNSLCSQDDLELLILLLPTLKGVTTSSFSYSSEPKASGIVGKHSYQLNYIPNNKLLNISLKSPV